MLKFAAFTCLLFSSLGLTQAQSPKPLRLPYYVYVDVGEKATALYHRDSCPWLSIALSAHKQFTPADAEKRYYRPHCKCISGVESLWPCADTLPAPDKPTPNDRPAATVANPASSNAAIVGNESDIGPHCAAEWPDDFAMRAYCAKQQNEALARMRTRPMPNYGDFLTIRNKCAKDWPKDFSMRDYCEIQQLKARTP